MPSTPAERAEVRRLVSWFLEKLDSEVTAYLVTEKVLKRAGMKVEDIALIELNEAFAAVVLRFMKHLNIPHDKVNVHGGACALGHPIGCSGTRIVVTLLAALANHGKKRGIASLCIGGGEATALAVELI